MEIDIQKFMRRQLKKEWAKNEEFKKGANAYNVTKMAPTSFEDWLILQDLIQEEEA